jgi:transposase
MSISEHKHVSEVVGAPAQRIELFTGTGRRRIWTSEQKAAIVAESYTDGVKACQVARRHGLTPQQLFGWRREARVRTAEPAPPVFVPAMIEAPPRAAQKAPQRESSQAPAIELEIDGVTVRVGRGAEAKTIAAVIRALKAGA